MQPPNELHSFASTFLAGAARLGTSDVTRIEVVSALQRKVSRYNPAELTAAEASAAYQQFDADWRDLIQVHVDGDLWGLAEDMAWQHALRGYDAVHLASAIRLGEVLGELVTLATFDRELWAAAQAESLPVWPNDIDVALRQP